VSLDVVVASGCLTAVSLSDSIVHFILSTSSIVFLHKDVYTSFTLPTDLSLKDFFTIITGAFFIVILSSFYPAKKASEVDILTVLRNE